MLYFKKNKALPEHKIANLNGWKLLEYNIPAYDRKTHTVGSYEFEELDNKVIANAIIKIKEKREK